MICMMKYMISMLCAMLLFVSCRENDYCAPIRERQNALAFRLQSINDSLMRSRSGSEARGVSSVARFLGVATADISGALKFGKLGGRIGSIFGPKGTVVGATIGAVAGGAGYSYVAYESTRPRRALNPDSVKVGNWTLVSPIAIDFSKDPFDDENSSQWGMTKSLQFPDRFKHVQRRGAEHNAVLDVIRNGNSKYWECEMPELTEEEKSIINSPELASEYQRDIELIECGNMKYGQTDDPMTNVAIGLFLEVYNSYPQNGDDVVELVNIYAKEIADSPDFSDEEKSSILSSLSVAAYSFFYWQSDKSEN